MNDTNIVIERPTGELVVASAADNDLRVSVMRPSRARVAELCIPHIEAAIEMCREIIDAKRGKGELDLASLMEIKTSDRLNAAKIILAYGAGLPVQMIEGAGDEGEHVVKVRYE